MAVPSAPPKNRSRAAAHNRPDRRAAILLAAEKLFAEHGYHAVSIRQIALEAQVPLALVAYYYGQKHELFHAIFAHWRGTIDARMDLLREAQASPPDSGHLRRIVEAFVNPVLAMRASSEGEYYAQLVDYFAPLAHAFIDALHAARPGTARTQVAWAYQFAMGALLHHLIDHRVERLSRGANTSHDPQAASLLIDFMAAGIAALLPVHPSP